LHVAAGVRAWDDGRGRLGLVVGATAPREMVAVREAAPDLAFLVPGAGVQGGDAAAVLPAARATAGAAGGLVGGGALINVSRAIASAALDGHDPEEAVDAAARRWARRLQC
ncbi:MAG: orotidine 5'-phosphate decarboxylase, partial [Chloroflexi bacterium]|nr:orotidine 5'-phosphate decarboxylase [Chloroflexota bacterium]